MKNRILVFLGVSLAVAAAPGISRAGIVNGSFESGDLLGWNFQTDVGPRATEPLTRPAALARTMNAWGAGFGFSEEKTAAVGNRFLALNTRANANFLGTDTYHAAVSQRFSMNAGDILSGLAAFYNGDSEPLDSAWVRVLDQDGELLATLWQATSGPNLLAAPGVPGWTGWNWTAATAGDYTLQLGLTTSGADNAASYGFFDGISVAPQPIPEPSTLVLGFLGGFALLVLRQRRA
jgi:hypothetical protein